MCLNTQTRFTNSHYLSIVHYKPFLVSYPCGKCSECRSAKKSEWRLRAFYELKRMEKYKGDCKPFMLFDTLTYSDENLPYVSRHFEFAKRTCFDMPCFDRQDLKLFFKRLRSRLSRSGYDVKDKLRYFVSSEYGDENERPHYHLLFFVYFKIDPLVLSRFISQSWLCGKTDGVSPTCEYCPVKNYCKKICIYQSDKYVRNKRVFFSGDSYAINVAGYVAKYVTKDLNFDKKVRSCLHHLFNIKYRCLDWRKRVDTYEEYKKIYRNCSNFHLQSLGFGLFALEDNNIDDVVKNNSLSMSVSKKSVVVNVPLPMYYKRRLFQEKITFHGKQFWIYNQLGRRYALERFQKTRENMISRLYGLPTQIVSSGLFHVEKVRSLVSKFLDGRNLFEYVDYCLLVKGRVRFPSESLCNKEKSLIESISEDSYKFSILQNFQRLVYPLNHYKDIEVYQHPSVSFSEPLSKEYGDLRHTQLLNRISSSEFFDKYCYNSQSYEYRYFDELFDLICFVEKIINQKIDNFKIKNELQYERYKKLGFLKKV